MLAFLFFAESLRVKPWVGLLARKEQALGLQVASPSPELRTEWHSKRRAFTHSGGTAPDLHRTSPLCPLWAPKARGSYHDRLGRVARGVSYVEARLVP